MPTSNGDSHECAARSAEVVAFVYAIDGPYDYFGNPAGGTPTISFETKLGIDKQELALPFVE